VAFKSGEEAQEMMPEQSSYKVAMRAMESFEK
jgi:hypothetical protein